MSTDTDIVIIGGGIVGVTTAYYLTQDAEVREKDLRVTLIEEGEIAGGASGKAAGFLAKDWFGSATEVSALLLVAEVVRLYAELTLH